VLQRLADAGGPRHRGPDRSRATVLEAAELLFGASGARPSGIHSMPPRWTAHADYPDDDEAAAFYALS
jgi:hypothetical protein